MDTLLLRNIAEDGMFAAMAAIGFSSISRAPGRTYFVCGLAAAAGHALRYVLMNPACCGIGIVAASPVAAFVAGLIAVLLAPVVKAPAEACVYPALLPMIPGMYAYRTVEGLVACLSDSAEECFGHYFYLLSYNGLTCVAIVLGMVLGANLPIFMLKRVSFQATR